MGTYKDLSQMSYSQYLIHMNPEQAIWLGVFAVRIQGHSLDVPTNSAFGKKLMRASPDNVTSGYLDWRDQFVPTNEDMLDFFERADDATLFAALNALAGGLAHEKLCPKTTHADFHFAAGIIGGCLIKRGYIEHVLTYVHSPPTHFLDGSVSTEPPTV